MKYGLIDLNLLDNEISFVSEMIDESDESAYNNFMYVRKVMSSQRKLLEMALEIIRLCYKNYPVTNSLLETFSEYLKQYFKEFVYAEPLKVYNKKSKSWMIAIAEFDDSYILEFGEDVIISDKKDISKYEDYIKAFEKKLETNGT